MPDPVEIDMPGRARTCRACLRGAHSDCDVFIDEGAVDVLDFVGLECACYDEAPEYHDRRRHPERFVPPEYRASTSRLFRSKPSEIEAVQWLGDNLREVMDFLEESDEELAPLQRCRRPDLPAHPFRLLAGKDGAQGFVEVPVGHWIVRNPGDLSDHWPVANAYFQTKYEPVPTPAWAPRTTDEETDR